MKNGKWKIENEKWKSGKWKITNGKWKTENDKNKLNSK